MNLRELVIHRNKEPLEAFLRALLAMEADHVGRSIFDGDPIATRVREKAVWP